MDTLKKLVNNKLKTIYFINLKIYFFVTGNLKDI